jgi:Tol biopolymer transport system component
MSSTLGRLAAAAGLAGASLTLDAQAPAPWTPSDLHRLQAVGDVEVSPAGTHVAYTIVRNTDAGRPQATLTIRNLATGATHDLPRGASGPRWAPGGRQLAYLGPTPEGYGLVVGEADGSGARLVAKVEGTNHPLPSSGASVAWAPDGRRVAFVSSTPGPEHAGANGDPMVITRYLYKPTAGEGLTRFNDNRRTHVFVADVRTRQVTQLTDGAAYEHSIDWAPSGDAIAFVSNREADADRVFNYDLLTVSVTTKAITRLTSTKAAEYTPAWSPDGTKIAFLGTVRDLTSSETTMEDTHVWVMNADGTGRVEIGKAIDNRQGAPQWSSDGRHVYFTVQDRGSVHLVRLPAGGGLPDTVVGDRGSVGAWSVGGDLLAYAFASPTAPADLYTIRGSSTAERRTSLNAALLAERAVSDVEAFRFPAADGTEIGTEPVWIVAVNAPPGLPLGPVRGKVRLATTGTDGTGTGPPFDLEVRGTVVEDIVPSPGILAFGRQHHDPRRPRGQDPTRETGIERARRRLSARVVDHAHGTHRRAVRGVCGGRRDWDG